MYLLVFKSLNGAWCELEFGNREAALMAMDSAHEDHFKAFVLKA